MSDQGWTAPGSTGPGQDRPPAPPAQPTQPLPSGQPPYAGQGPYPGQPPQQGFPPPQQGFPPRRLDFRPGIIPLRPLRMDDIFGGVFRAVRGNIGATVGLGALTSAIFLVPLTALGAWVSSLEPSISIEDSVDSGGTAGLMGTFGSFIPSIGSWISTILLAGFLAYVIGQAVLGRKVTAAETWNGTKGRIWALIGATVLSVLVYTAVILVVFAVPAFLLIAGGDGGIALGFLGIFLGMFVAVVAFMFLWTRLAFVTPSIVLEHRGVGAAFARSWRLSGGDLFWRLLGIRLLAALAIAIVSSLITMPLALLASGLLFTGMTADQLYVWQAIITGVSGIVAGALTTPITAGIDALLFVDHRIRREGLDVHLIQTSQGMVAPPWPRAEA